MYVCVCVQKANLRASCFPKNDITPYEYRECCKDQNGFDEWTEIPEGFARGCAIAVKSKQEIWLIGGWRTEERILSFNVESQTFQVMPFQLNVGTQMCFHSKHQQNHDNRWS